MGQVPLPRLEGDVHALKLIDLDREGLSEYKSQIDRLASQYLSPNQQDSQSQTSEFVHQSKLSKLNLLNEVIPFKTGNLNFDETHQLVISLNKRMGINNSDYDFGNFYQDLGFNNDGSVDIRNFRTAYERNLLKYL